VVVLVASALKLLGASNQLVLGISMLIAGTTIATNLLQRDRQGTRVESPAAPSLEAPPAE
jgi:hypothetical protein